MKMKKVAIKFSAIVLMAASLASCGKKKNTPPEQDKEFQSAIDAAAATMIVSDIDMMVSFTSEYSYMPLYAISPSSPPGSIVSVNRNDTLNKKITISFVNSPRCRDGKVRNGTIQIDFSKAYPTGTVSSSGQTYIRNPHHWSKVTFINYSVNQFKIKNESTFDIANTTPAGYTRSVTPLTWNVDAEMFIIDTTKSANDVDIHWKGVLKKTLVNSTSNTIHPSTSMPIVWTTTNNAVAPSSGPKPQNAIVRYSGTATGFTSKDKQFTFTIDAEKQLERDLGCSPDYYINPGHCPIGNGKVRFKTADKSDRWLYFGDADGNKHCDNSGVIYINGLNYGIDFIH